MKNGGTCDWPGCDRDAVEEDMKTGAERCALHAMSDAAQAERARKLLDACSYFNLPGDDIAREITGVDCGNQYTGGQDF